MLKYLLNYYLICIFVAYFILKWPGHFRFHHLILSIS